MTYTYSEELYSDYHKAAYGSRPTEWSWKHWNEMTPDQKQAEWDYLGELFEENEQREFEDASQSVSDFEEMFYIFEKFAPNRKTAVRYLIESEDIRHSQDAEHFLWGNGVLFTEYGKAFLAEMMNHLEY